MQELNVTNSSECKKNQTEQDTTALPRNSTIFTATVFSKWTHLVDVHQ